MLSYEAVSKIDRDGRNLQSPLSITHSDEGNTITNILSPSVPYKKRNNIKNEHISNEIKLTNTYEQLTDVRASIPQHEAIDLEINIAENMTDASKPEDIKTESITVEMEMMNPVPNTVRLEPLINCTNPAEAVNFTSNYIEPATYHTSHAIFGHEISQDVEQVWIPDINEGTKTIEEKKQWTDKSSFLDPANWKRTMLTEEEAIEKFRNRALDPKFVNARYKCMDCYSNFARDEMLRKHILINHVESLGPHMCRLCKRRFHKACKLRLHMKRHYVQIQCLRCNMIFWGEGLAFQHEEFHRGVTTTCQYCNHQFRHKSTYYQHLRTHHRSAHVCALCGASFVSKAGLNVHKKRLHATDDKEMCKEPDANIYCKRCDMKFATLAAYQEHYRHSALHADGMDYPMVMGEDIKGPNASRQPYVRCTVCQEQFFTYQACMKHHRHHHPAVPFMKKSISYSGKTNERVNCELCGALIKVTSLYTHMNAHTRTKVYTCDICEMQFNYPTSLLRHKVTHTGEKKYPCPLCEKRFTQRNSMQLHYRTFHLKEPYPKRNRQKKKVQSTEPPPMML